MLTDTLNWILITGTFTANGTEKYMMLGNFKSDIATGSVVINPTNSVTIVTDILYEDVSVIDIDLPAFAGYDYYQAPGDSAFIGRTPDVGINEACTWFQLPNMAAPIATVAGLYVKPSVTATYVVRQEICGIVKWDTVVVFQSGVGINEVSQGSVKDAVSLFPNPSNGQITLSSHIENDVIELSVKDLSGRLLIDKSIRLNNYSASLTLALKEGVYVVSLQNQNHESTNKKLVISSR